VPENIDEIVDVICKLLLQNPQEAYDVRILFSSLLLPIASKLLVDDVGDLKSFQQKCIALSIFSETNQQVLR
jgi:hypothetical protein